MATIPTYFTDFLALIRPNKAEREACQAARDTLVEQLRDYPDIKEVLVDTFLQGSMKRATALTAVNGKRSDVDIVVVTQISESDHTPLQAIQRFVPFLEEFYPDEMHRIQGRSLGIFLPAIGDRPPVDIDLVVTSAPTEAVHGLFRPDLYLEDNLDSWDALPREVRLAKAVDLEKAYERDPLRIPDREAQEWQSTHPHAQMKWTVRKNAGTNGHYVNVVKCLKWWQRRHAQVRKPKGYELEALVGDCCPDGISSVAEGVALTMRNIAKSVGDTLKSGERPVADDHGIGGDALARVDIEDLQAFQKEITAAADLASSALDADDTREAALRWGRLFGEPFPKPPEPKPDLVSVFTPRTQTTEVKPARFA